MTNDQLLARAIKNRPKGWRVDVTGAIRCVGTCPLSAAAGLEGCDFWTAGNRLRLSMSRRDQFWVTADNMRQDSDFSERLRLSMLLKFGLTERAS